MQEIDPTFESLLEHLKETRGFDFTGYRRTSLRRRVDRRMREIGIEGYDEYLDYMGVHADELTALFNAILVNVTSFFRDAECWDYLRRHVLPDLIAAEAAGQLRVWSAGCASGQEAYSLAIAFADAMGVEQFRERVKIYATDVDDEALAQARQAAYSQRELKGLTPEQVETYFEKAGTRYVFRKDLRRSLIFGRNDLVQDVPISRIDLLACRNTLMYFTAETRTQILERLYLALDDDGVLFLGKAEMPLGHAELFTPIDFKHRFFSRSTGRGLRERPRLPGHAPALDAAGAVPDLARLQNQALLALPAPQLIVAAGGQLAFSNADADALLGLGERDVGRPFQDLEVCYRPVELGSSLAQVRQDRRTAWLRDVEWLRAPRDRATYDVQLTPLSEADGTLLGVSITFHETTRYRVLQDELERANGALHAASSELQSTVEELETTNEELQSTVEELETTNEELQSTNEELETMNEELQSTNDELQSINTEVRERTGEVSELNAFLESILTSLRAGVVVVDRDLRVQVWNRQSEELWGVRQDEAVGQHLLTLDTGLPMEAVKPVLRRVLLEDGDGRADGSAVRGQEVEVRAHDRWGRPIAVRVSASPLLTLDGGSPAGALLLVEQDGSAPGAVSGVGSEPEPGVGCGHRGVESASAG